MPPSAVGVDIGGTKVAAGVVDDAGVIGPLVRLDSPREDPDAAIEVIAQAVEQLGPPADGLEVGVGAAGITDLDGVVRFAPNLGWTNVSLRERLRVRLGRPVSVENDANAAAWAEFRAGAAAHARNSAVMLTLGTGVGGGYIAAGQLMRGATGLAGEFGHLIVCYGGRRCGCGNTGCLEAYASGTAIGALAAERRAAGAVTPSGPLDRDGITGRDVAEAAVAGDAQAQEVMREAGTWLGIGLASIANALDPEVLVLGGGATAAGDLLLDPAREAFAARLMGREHRPLPPIVPAALGPGAGIIGAALLRR